MFSDIFAQIGPSETGFRDPSARVAAISTIDKRIDTATHAWRQFLCSLLTRRNTFVPISLLPPEILSLVFHLLVLEEPPLSWKGNVGWIKVTHVCRHWRQVAIDNSSLWARTSGIPKTTKWISEMLARAKNAPLDIDFNDFVNSNREMLLMIPSHLPHTRQLRLHDLSLRHSGIIQEIFSWEAPALEHFELMARYSTVTFPDLGGNMLFKGHSPRLRTFSISKVVIPWSLVPRGQLTQLKITGADEDDHSPGDLTQLINLLVNCPALEILALDSCLPTQPTEFPHGRTIHLPHLSRLRLRSKTSRIMNMLKMLKLPSLTILHLHCVSEIASIHNDPEVLLLSVISAQFQCPAPVEFKSLTVAAWGHMNLTINASTFSSTLGNRRTQNFEDDIASNPELVLSFDKLSKPGHSTDLLKQACKMLPISNLEFISMSADTIIDINWVEFFGYCTNVTTMQAIGQGTSSLVQALSVPTVTNVGPSKKGRKRKRNNGASTAVQPASTVAHADAAIFPNLQFLGLRELTFSEGILFDVFERGLQQRMEVSGAPLKFLHISDCDISTEHANDLGDLVQDFHFDKREIPVDRYESSDSYDRHLYDYDRQLYDYDRRDFLACHRVELLERLDMEGYDLSDWM